MISRQQRVVVNGYHSWCSTSLHPCMNPCCPTLSKWRCLSNQTFWKWLHYVQGCSRKATPFELIKVQILPIYIYLQLKWADLTSSLGVKITHKVETMLVWTYHLCCSVGKPYSEEVNVWQLWEGYEESIPCHFLSSWLYIGHACDIIVPCMHCHIPMRKPFKVGSTGSAKSRNLFHEELMR